MTRTERYNFIIDWFEKNMPLAETELEYEDPYELIVAVILSAQCTDKTSEHDHTCYLSKISNSTGIEQSQLR
jgi:endonuclease III